ncbi:unnamed protein product, partial [Urochloa humidicola]
ASDPGRWRQCVGKRRRQPAACLPQRGGTAPPTRQRGGSGGSILCSSIKSLVGKQDPGKDAYLMRPNVVEGTALATLA